MSDDRSVYHYCDSIQEEERTVGQCSCVDDRGGILYFLAGISTASQIRVCLCIAGDSTYLRYVVGYLLSDKTGREQTGNAGQGAVHTASDVGTGEDIFFGKLYDREKHIAELCKPTGLWKL